ncbi:hypothetical protein ACH5RR_040811 [Cinchona calisaya]|uniref:Uncharacterized protein n=1 Tax=Cinchona calisaya TaxID=153742 RepID=A0ABD2XXU7_9GENT
MWIPSLGLSSYSSKPKARIVTGDSSFDARSCSYERDGFAKGMITEQLMIDAQSEIGVIKMGFQPLKKGYILDIKETPGTNPSKYFMIHSWGSLWGTC